MWSLIRDSLSFLLTFRGRQDKSGTNVQNTADSGFDFSGITEYRHIKVTAIT